MKYDGSAFIAPAGQGRFSVFVEAPNVTATVYITRKKAKDIHEHLGWILYGHLPIPAATKRPKGA